MASGNQEASPTLSAETVGPGRDTVPEYRALARDLTERVAGDVAFDEYAQLLYATDGSIYQARPAGVVCPTDVEDVRAAVSVAADHDVPVLPRGAGSSLAGQAVGPGCVVLDCSRYMDDIVDIDPEAKQATVQPGVVLDHLNAAAAEYDLTFAPDPASANRATVGGAIGNNSTGAHSVRYGITDAYTDELRVLLANGDLIHTRDVVLDSPEYERIVEEASLEAHIYETVRTLVEDNESEIRERYPELKRSVSGYNLHKVIRDVDGETVINLSKLFVGAEGTLGVVVEATVSLVSMPDETALAVYTFDTLTAALEAVPEALDYPVSAVELMDDEVFRLARNSDGYARYAEPIPEGTAAVLMVEWDDELVTPGEYGVETQREAFEAAVGDVSTRLVENGDALEAIEAFTDDAQDRFWKLRKAAIPLLMSLEGDAKPYPFIEDATVPPAELATYVDEFEDVLASHDTSAAYFAHAGSGTLHIRPILDLKTESGVETMRSITDAVTDLVLEHEGAFSGEHGDGMARTAFTPKMYGEALWQAFKGLKTAVDGDWLFHPGNVVYRDGPDDVGPDSDRGVGADMRENLRYGPAYSSLEPQTTLDFEDDGGFGHLVELCNGCGTCRQTDTDVMCPTYRASEEEIQTTRGRANLLRAAISGELDESELYSERFQSEVLDLCVGCKGCKSDCPTGVDFAKLKAEVKHATHRESGASRRDRFFAEVDRFAGIGSRLAPLSNLGPKLPGSRWVMDRVLGIAPDRELPTFNRETFCDWFEARGGPGVPADEADARVLLFPDTVTNYSTPAPGKAAVSVLEAANTHVRVASNLAPSGRAAFSLGFLDDARDAARTNVSRLAPYVDDGWAILFVEPSDAVMFQDEYRDLLSGPDVAAVSAAAYGVMEFLDREGYAASLTDESGGEAAGASAGESIVYHGHCHQHAAASDHHAASVLREVGYEVDHLDSGCCGMAGSFGYESEHYDLSKAIGRIVGGQIRESDGERLTAPGASCRTQLGEYADGTRPPHPVETLADALPSVEY